jgi:hypothetical protein
VGNTLSVGFNQGSLKMDISPVRHFMGFGNLLASTTAAATGFVFVPNAGITVTAGDPSLNGSAVSFSTTGSWGARANPAPLLLQMMNEDGSNTWVTSPLSRTSATWTGTTGATTLLQTTLKPRNAQGATTWIPTPANGSNTGFIAFQTPGSGYCQFPGGAGTFVVTFTKVYYDMATQPDNAKMWRIWATGLVLPDLYYTHGLGDGGSVLMPVENNDNATNQGGSGHFIPLEQTTQRWDTWIGIFSENTANVSNGIFNLIRNGCWAFPQNTTYGPVWTGNGTGGSLTTFFLDEFTKNSPGTNYGNNVPNGSTDRVAYGIMFFDDSILQLIYTNEGATIQTSNYAAAAGGGVEKYLQEFQIQTARGNTTLSSVVRTGEFDSLHGVHIHAWTGYGTAVDLGYFQSTTANGPIINMQPRSVTMVKGRSVHFCVGAAPGTVGDAITYQWFKNGGSIGGATASTFNVTSGNVQPGNSGDIYTCTITETGTTPGTVTTANAVLTVSNPLPLITVQPSNQSVVHPATATFSVTALGWFTKLATDPILYQWFVNAGLIGGATSSSYTTPATTLGNNGDVYTCTVTETGDYTGSVTSNPATLTVT